MIVSMVTVYTMICMADAPHKQFAKKKCVVVEMVKISKRNLCLCLFSIFGGRLDCQCQHFVIVSTKAATLSFLTQDGGLWALWCFGNMTSCICFAFGNYNISYNRNQLVSWMFHNVKCNCKCIKIIMCHLLKLIQKKFIICRLLWY